MTLNEAMAEFGPSWLKVWLPLLLLGGFVGPLALIFWTKTRMIGIISLVASVIAAIAIDYMYKQMGYVKLLGIPHVIMWSPLIVYLILQSRRDDFTAWPKRILTFMIVIIGISLVFDYVDVIRYFMGNTLPLVTYEAA